jgi:hypothetical protein
LGAFPNLTSAAVWGRGVVGISRSSTAGAFLSNFPVRGFLQLNHPPFALNRSHSRGTSVSPSSKGFFDEERYSQWCVLHLLMDGCMHLGMVARGAAGMERDPSPAPSDRPWCDAIVNRRSHAFMDAVLAGLNTFATASSSSLSLALTSPRAAKSATVNGQMHL